MMKAMATSIRYFVLCNFSLFLTTPKPGILLTYFNSVKIVIILNIYLHSLIVRNSSSDSLHDETLLIIHTLVYREFIEGLTAATSHSLSYTP
jgi:hypothetical protein